MTAYFDRSVETSIIVDASPVGVCATLLQAEPDKNAKRVLCYALTSLTPVEQRYSQIEREMIALVFGAERCLWVYGSKFNLSPTIKHLFSC